MHEDWMLDEEFRVDSSSDFLNGLSPDEQEFLFSGRAGMKPCENCGEWCNKEYMTRDYDNYGKLLCGLCSKSEFHAEKRGTTHTASNNFKSDIEFLREFNNRE